MLEVLLQEFGRSMGIPDLVLDEQDGCALMFDETGLMLSYRREANRLCVYTDIGLLKRATPALLLKLLSANALHQAVGDGVIGVSPDEGRKALVIVYSQLLDVAVLTLPRLDESLRGFVETAEAWQTQLAEYVQGLDAEGEAQEYISPEDCLRYV